MMAEMTHWERVRAALRGEEVDRLPVSMWRHFFTRETSASLLAEAMLGFQDRFDWDFMKVNPRASYHVEPWGAKIQFSTSEYVKTQIIDYPVKKLEDWRR